MQRRCDRNRKRSKRRAIYCPIHECYLDSVSKKYPLFADKAGQLQQRGINRKKAMLVISSYNTVAIPGEWLEAFWCGHCQDTTWYHVCKSGDRTYTIRPAPEELWQQVYGVANPSGNPSVSEFTRRQARNIGAHGMKDFDFARS